MATRFPNLAEWVDCAHGLSFSQANTLTVLNARALSMGLELEPVFSAQKLCNGSDNFFSQAYWLFEQALSDHLHWKLLLAFSRCTRYTEGHSQEAGGGEDDGTSGPHEEGVGNGTWVMPSQDRRFDLRVRGFQQLLEQQRAADSVSYNARKAMDIHFAGTETALRFGKVQSHTDKLACDSWSKDFEREVVQPPFVTDVGR